MSSATWDLHPRPHQPVAAESGVQLCVQHAFEPVDAGDKLAGGVHEFDLGPDHRPGPRRYPANDLNRPGRNSADKLPIPAEGTRQRHGPTLGMTPDAHRLKSTI